MTIQFTEIPGWQFFEEEVSAGVYKVQGKDNLGRTVEVCGVDPEKLIEECKKFAEQCLGQQQKEHQK